MAEGKNLIGVDIGSSSIKVCQLKEGRKGYVLSRLGYAPLPRRSIVDGQIMNGQAIVETLIKLFSDAKIKQREVALSIHGQAIMIRKITVPLMNQAELSEQMLWEAEQHIPYNIKETQVDYEVLRRRPETGQMDLMLVAAKRDGINAYTEIAKRAKLKPLVVDVDAFTVQNLFESNQGSLGDQTMAIINVGASVASINVIAHGASAFTRDIGNGGHHISELLEKQMGVPFQQAESFKIASSAAPQSIPPQAAQIIEQACDTIAGEIQRSLDFFLATSGEAELARIYLTGGSANLGQLRTAIGRRSRVEVEVIQPLARIGVETKDVDPKLLNERAMQLCVALGLAMRKDKERRA